MKIRVERTELAKALKTVAPAVHKGGSLPVLLGLRIDATSGALTLTATNGELVIDTTIEADVVSPGVVIPPAGLLSRLVGALGAGAVELEADDERLTVTCGDVTAVLPLLPVEDWPRLIANEGEAVTLTSEECRRLQAILPMASDDTKRAHLQCAHFAGHSVTVTDSYRAAILTVAAEMADVNVPAALVLMVLRQTESVDVIADERMVTFLSADHSTSWRIPTVVADYPNIAKLLRESSPHSWTFDAAPLREALERAEQFGEDPCVVRIERDGDSALISLARSDNATLAETVRVDGDFDEAIGFNAGYLASLIEATDTDSVTIGLAGSLKACMVRCDGLDMLLMPSKIGAPS